MRKVQLGAGGHNLAGWENYDFDVDIRKPLPFPDNDVDFIMIEHTVEHVTQLEAFNFFKECRRVLRQYGVLRVIIPDTVKIYKEFNEMYADFVKSHLHREVTREVATEQIMVNFDHKAFWTQELLEIVLRVAGFNTRSSEYNKSEIPELDGIECHWRAIGMPAASFESIVIEAMKP